MVQAAKMLVYFLLPLFIGQLVPMVSLMGWGGGAHLVCQGTADQDVGGDTLPCSILFWLIGQLVSMASMTGLLMHNH